MTVLVYRASDGAFISIQNQATKTYASGNFASGYILIEGGAGYSGCLNYKHMKVMNWYTKAWNIYASSAGDYCNIFNFGLI